MSIYIYEQKGWPAFIWNDQRLITLLSKARNQEGVLIGNMQALGFSLREEASLETITLEIVKSNEIEGEELDTQQVRSSIARRLGIEIGGLVPSDRDVDGVVDMVLEAIQNYQAALTKERLFDWHFALFPSERSGMLKIKVGKWRDDATGPMQVVSGYMGREQIHYQAPAAASLDKEMDKFLHWVNSENSIDPVLKAAVAHLWFLTIHPFDDGNGRIARAITDMLLARAEGVTQRFYSISVQIRKDRKQYYEVLERAQKSTLDITDWLEWFLNCLLNALSAADEILQKVIFKHKFWTQHAKVPLNERQIKVLNKLIEGFEGKLTTGKWAKITKCSSDTALRDIKDLIDKNILSKDDSGGRNTSYLLIGPI
ncbi:MAG: Fic family protein [Phaeodactylibacter sp.]|nr:Fic family protein [Phaeodactylibacter sp.]